MSAPPPAPVFDINDEVEQQQAQQEQDQLQQQNNNQQQNQSASQNGAPNSENDANTTSEATVTAPTAPAPVEQNLKAEAFRSAMDRLAKEEADKRAHRIETRMLENERHATSGYGGQAPIQPTKKKRENKGKQSFAERIYAGKRLSPISILINDDGAHHAVCLLRYSGPRPQASGAAGLRSLHIVCNSEFGSVDSSGQELTKEQEKEIIGERLTLSPGEATQELSRNIEMLFRVCDDPQLKATCERLTLQLGTVLVTCGERSGLAFPVQDTCPFVSTHDLLREIEAGHVRPFFVNDSPFFVRSAMRKVCYTQHYLDTDGGCEASITLTHPDGVSDVFQFKVVFPTTENEHEFSEEDRRKKFVLQPISVTRDNVNTWWLLHLIPKGYHRRFEKGSDEQAEDDTGRGGGNHNNNHQRDHHQSQTRSGITVHGLDAAVHAEFVRMHLSKDHPNVAKAAAALERILEHELGYQIQNSKSDVSWMIKNFAPSLSPAYPKPGPTQPELLAPEAQKASQMTEEERNAVAQEAAKAWKEQLERERLHSLANSGFDEKAAEAAEAKVEALLQQMHQREDEEKRGDQEDEENNLREDDDDNNVDNGNRNDKKKGEGKGDSGMNESNVHGGATDGTALHGTAGALGVFPGQDDEPKKEKLRGPGHTRGTLNNTKATVTSATLAAIGKNIFSKILPDGSERKANNIYAYYSLDELFPRRGNIDDMIIVRASVCRRELFKKSEDSPFTVAFTRSTNYELAAATGELHPANGARLRITRVPDAIVRNEMRQCCVEYTPVDFFTHEQNSAVFSREAIHLAYDVATGLNRLCSLNNRDSRDAATFGRDIVDARNQHTTELDNGMLTSTGRVVNDDRDNNSNNNYHNTNSMENDDEAF